MARTNNYLIQAMQAKQRFLTYDQNRLIQKLQLLHDGNHLYVTLLRRRYRIERSTGDMEKEAAAGWKAADSYEEIMTLLDLVCDSKENRHLTGAWKNMTDFGLMFHRKLLETEKDPWAEKFQAQPEAFRSACEALGGISFPQGDIAYAIELFDGLSILVQLWFGDEEFPACLRFLWDENALMYIKYETMYFAKGLLLQEIEKRM